MFHKPIGYFLIGLILFLLAIGILNFSAVLIGQVAANWLAIVCLLASQLFVWMAVIKGIGSIKRKENGSIYNLIAVIGSVSIIILAMYWTFTLYTLYQWLN
jgi:hypothetical protein